MEGSAELDKAKKEFIRCVEVLKKDADFIDGVVLGALMAVGRKKAEQIVDTFMKLSKLQDVEEQYNDQSK